MLLKKIEMVGFKSFADKITIDFVKGVTAIVGPNGSGKSNVTEAIRWVLGEQSAKSLRGSKMEDVIFSGSDSKRKMQMAQVTITFDNPNRTLPIDYSEVSVTRRVYRSGESEFLINQQPCRLKDIIELFMDSGLGKEAFSIISQGKVDEILNSKPEDRRKIFEEAAGVLKYKNRKRQAEDKLEETEGNLHRVEDIIHEIHGQLEPLEMQASIARDYLDKKEELEHIEVAVTVAEIEHLHASWKDIGQKLAHKNSDAERLEAQKMAYQSEVTTCTEQLTALEKEFEENQTTLYRHKQELEKLEGQKKVLAERKRNAHQNKDRYEAEVKELTEATDWSKDQLARERATLKSEEKSFKKLEDQLKEKQAWIATNEWNAAQDIDALKSDYIEAMNKAAAANNEIRYIEDQLQRNEEKQRRLERQNQNRIDERNRLTSSLKKAEDELIAQQATLREIVTNIDTYKTDVAREREELKKLQDKLYQAYHYVREQESKMTVIKQMQEGYEGFYSGVKAVLKAKSGRLQEVHGAVAEVIRVPQNYETAIETALGTQQQHIITSDESSARQAIQFLRANRQGRATFLPLTTIQPRTIPDHVLDRLSSMEGWVGQASTLVQTDDTYKQVVQHLLGHILIAKNLTAANQMASASGRRHKIVTLEGDVVNPGGSMTGGQSNAAKSSFVSRKNDLARLESEHQMMKEKTAKLEAAVNERKKLLESRQHESSQWEEQKAAIEEEVNEASRKKESYVLELKHANEHLTLFDQENRLVRSEIEQLSSRLDALKTEKEDADRLVQETNETILQTEKQKKIAEEHLQQTNEECTQIKIAIAQKKESLHYQKEKVDHLQKEHDRNSARLRQRKEELSLLSEDMSKGQMSAEEITKHIEVFKQEIADSEEKHGQLAAQKNDLQEMLTKQQSVFTSLSERLDELHKDIQTLDIQNNRLDVTLENHLNKLQVEYNLSFEKAKLDYPLEINLEEARERVALIKRGIEELGNVNIGAIEEFDRIHERYTFLQGQREDLQQAKATLYDIIQEMDQEMSKRFLTSFEEIRYHFGQIFTELFGGGAADLILTSPKEILTSGVDIVCQPPGKKRRNLSLLSGGERALTAIALLFAILKARPVPFCVLDEVEAALDEANVVRFAQFLKRFSQGTQFIVITHRKGTMEEAEVLYGVTMQGSGVSKVLSVQLEEAKQSVLV
ncbi:chromosome segregation protein SMC [Bacillaceae bacterium SIJ1]|uniref:chromosome segregation protein SMC n=1 Tax=Litoribacterium kuwaitense TaxID=1398745 RepID=UPI0013ED7A57|nr:chromosome segregation protein SMC [Litoribacterium kuwaitense]NGP44155.1 chromosome segregation protein SMC [Litoribacterium kuwaitense]